LSGKTFTPTNVGDITLGVMESIEMATRIKDIDLKHKIVEYFIDIAATYKTFPQSFTPSIIGTNIGAYIPRIGSVADAVIEELQGRGIDIEYKKEGNKRRFIIHGQNP
jgi:hypothetical protein